ncbi:UxaA family hydrolase [Tropicimonas marinistellae]|uniref:UxaA family hydrolase n=1 Tax=Tropicimonas marinistellae TaxID=1739787 RepID=UPI00082EBEEF|nr:UxaA family hydrolase [Tropicimonas marinistellae]
MSELDDGPFSDLILLDPADNIAVLARGAEAGRVEAVGSGTVTLAETLGMGHKVAVKPIARGDDVLKYGFPIGVARCDIAPGSHVHLHNLESRYTVIRDWEAQS